MSLKHTPTHLFRLSSEGVVNCDQYVGVRVLVGTDINACDPLSKKIKQFVSAQHVIIVNAVSFLLN